MLRMFLLFQLRGKMLSKMTTVLLESPSNTAQEVQVTARAVAGLTQYSDELTPSAQVHCLHWETPFRKCIPGVNLKGVFFLICNAQVGKKTFAN